ncbi:substrate-binding periplasmic protein [Thalassospira lucentensis]|uniref:substrate-binding periplasmic protein n=1 Tax=Thalassospira lucentensis TaxID=168935 RepID=UPI003D2F115F
MTTVFPPYVMYSDQTGEASGPAVDTVRGVCLTAEITCNVRVEPWARAYATALETPNTLIFSVARRPDREDKFHWIGTVSPYHVRLFSLRESSVPEVADWHALSSFPVAGQLGDVKAQYLQNAGFDVEFVPSAETTIRMLYAGRAMLVAGDSLSLPYRVRALDIADEDLHIVAQIPELSTELYLAASLSTDALLVENLRQALDELKRNGSYERIWSLSGVAPTN